MTERLPPQTPAVIIRLIETPGFVLALAAQEDAPLRPSVDHPFSPPLRGGVSQPRTPPRKGGEKG